MCRPFDVSPYYHEYCDPDCVPVCFRFVDMVVKYDRDRKTPFMPDLFVLSYFARQGIDIAKIHNDYAMVVKNQEMLYKGFAKYGHAKGRYTAKEIERSLHILRYFFYPFCHDSRIMPMEKVEQLIPKKSSPGEPSRSVYACSTKSEAIKRRPELLDPESLYSDWYPVLNCASVKVEMKKKKKIIENDVRVFIVVPIEHFIWGCRFFFEFAEHFKSCGLKTPSCIGPTSGIYGCSYDRIVKWLHFDGVDDNDPYYLSLDFKKYDSLVRPSMYLDILYPFHLEMMSSEDKFQYSEEIWLWFLDVVYAYVRIGHEVVQKYSGNTSGNYMTSIHNTMGVIVNFYLAVWSIMEEIIPDVTLCELIQYSNVVANGDDHLIHVHPDASTFITGEKLKQWYEQHDLLVKTEDLAFKKLTEVTFMSRYFVKPPEINMWMPSPDPEKMWASLIYHVTEHSFFCSMQRAISLRNESFWNKTLFDQFDGFIKEGFASQEYMSLPKNGFASRMALHAMDKSPSELFIMYTQIGENLSDTDFECSCTVD